MSKKLRIWYMQQAQNTLMKNIYEDEERKSEKKKEFLFSKYNGKPSLSSGEREGSLIFGKSVVLQVP